MRGTEVIVDFSCNAEHDASEHLSKRKCYISTWLLLLCASASGAGAEWNWLGENNRLHWYFELVIAVKCSVS